MSSTHLAVYSRRMATVTFWLIPAMFLINAACWIWPALTTVAVGAGPNTNEVLVPGLRIDLDTFPFWQKLGAIGLSSVPLITLAIGLRHLRALFQYFAHGEYFSPVAASELAKMAKAVGYWVVLDLLCQPLLSVWSTIREPLGERVITLNIGSSDIVALFLAVSVALVARVLQRASELDAEHSQFI